MKNTLLLVAAALAFSAPSLADGSISTNVSRSGLSQVATMSGAGVTCTSGAGVSALTLDPTCPAPGGVVVVPIVNSDVDGCTITVAETSAQLGCRAIVQISSSAGGPIKMASVSNVFVAGGTWLPVVGDILDMTYTDLANDAWVQSGQHYAMRIDDAPLNVSTNGKGNVVVGFNSGLVLNDTQATVGGLNNTFVGAEVGTLNTTGNQNTFVGSRAGSKMITGVQSTCVGQGACYDNVVDSAAAYGFHAGLNFTDMTGDTFIGTQAGEGQTDSSTGTLDTAVGFKALQICTSCASNTAVGYLAGAAQVTTSGNVFVGTNAGKLETGASNVIIGSNAMQAASAGQQNIVIGNNAGNVLNDSNTVVVGFAACISCTTATGNTVIGDQAGFTGTALTTGDNNTLIGKDAGVSSATSANRSALGFGATSASDNNVQLGNTSVTTVTMNGRIRHLNAPTSVTSGTCTSETLRSGGGEDAGEVTATCTAQTWIVLFTTTYGRAPVCNVTPMNAASSADVGTVYTTSTTALTVTITTATTSGVWAYQCAE